MVDNISYVLKKYSDDLDAAAAFTARAAAGSCMRKFLVARAAHTIKSVHAELGNIIKYFEDKEVGGGSE